VAAYILATHGGTHRELGAAFAFVVVNLVAMFVSLLSVARSLPRRQAR
jgi:formate hydrogenlyase subunit 3/multisubunit Na+/H+ antiporter MnhD subunit